MCHRHYSCPPWLLPVLVLILICGSGPVSLAYAAIFTVDRTDDVASATACDDATPSDCSLRGAVSRANAAADHDDIVIPAGAYALSVAAPCTFKARIGENALSLSTVVLCLNSDLSIAGAGGDKTFIQGNGVDKVIAVSALKTVSITGATVRNGGDAPLTFQSGGGAGIMNHGTLTLSDSIVTANTILNLGGGIYNVGTLTVSRTLIMGNTAADQGAGGGILNSGDAGAGILHVEDSTVSDNTAKLGGGIANFFSGVATVTGSTVSGNIAGAIGGGIDNHNFSTLRVTNSTISGNQADQGGGIYNSSTTHLRNVTITANTAGTPGSGRGIGGGVSNLDSSPFTLQNTIIAGNTAHNLSFFAPDCLAFAGRSAALTSQGYNLIQNTANCDISGDLTGNITGQDARFGLLADNGGPVKTHALIDGSPAIDAGNPAAPGSGSNACAATDQRGFLRPLGTTCDIGAFERNGAFSLTRVLPNAGGNTNTVSAIVSGNGFVRGAAVKLVRAGQPDIVAQPVQVDAGGSAIAVTFDLTGKPTGSWNVVVTSPNGVTQTLTGGFIVEPGRAPQLWVDVIGRFFRPGRPSRLTILYGNRGNVDAVGVPFFLSIPKGYAPRRFFAITPPPPRPGQERNDWSQVPVTVDFLGENSDFIQIPLLLPVVPAGFTGILQIGLTLPLGAQDSLLLTSVGDPLFNSGLDPQVVSDAVAGAQAYLEGFNVTVSPALAAEMEQYAANQFRQVLRNGQAAFSASLGTQVQVYSMSHLRFDLVFFAGARAAQSPQASVSPAPTSGWVATAYRAFAFLWSQFGPAEAQAQQQDCPIPKKGEVLPEGCGGGGGPDEPFLPPGIPPPPGCNLKDPSTYKNCTPTEDHCDALPGYKVIQTSSGPFCVPEKPDKNCASKFAANPVGGNPGCIKFPLRPKNAVDPNDKVGTLGVTNAQFLLSTTPFSYTVNFENLATATAPAQVVLITDQLDVNTLDLDTFSLGPISFDDVTLVPAPGVQQYTGGVDLRPEQNLIVTIQASLEKTTGLVTWRFTSIDPDTGQLTEDPDAGFLPPNIIPPEGEGRVLFTVKPKSGLTTGTQICNQASIVFDTNAAIETPPWCNTIDQSPPSSQVAALSATQTTASFPVQWAGTDQGAGIADYTIFVSENGGPFTPFVSDTTDTSAQFTGQAGKTYAFYSVARDQVGNEEAFPGGPDTQTIVGGLDQCPNDPNKTDPGLCGCGVPDSEAGQACSTGQPGVCSVGINVCSAGTLSCQQNQQPSAEGCDGLDNNCNGTVDEGNPGGGDSCSTGLPGICDAGTQTCTTGTLVCRQTTQPGTEICGNNIDEDCDGADVACPPPPSADVCIIPPTSLDTFNRADGSVGTNWRGATGTTFYRLVGNRLDVQAGGPLYWNPAAFGPNQAAVVTLSTVDAKSPSQGVLLKMQNSSVPSAGAIAVVYDAPAQAVRVSTIRVGALAWTPYGNTAVPFTNGDKLGACAKANGEVRVYKNDVLVKTVTLSAADQGFFNAKGGKVGIWTLLAPRAFLDNFGGATVTP